MTNEELQELRLQERLARRWDLPENRTALEGVVAALRAKQPWAHLLKNLPEVEDTYEGQDLRGAPLAGAHLPEAIFGEAMLYFADLSGANLANADLRWTSLSNANFSHADLRGAYFTGNFLMHRVNFSGANLTEAEMAYTTIENADMSNANLTDAHLNNAVLISVKMDGAILKGLNTHNTSFREYVPEAE